MRIRSQRGNILFLILLAIILFVALSFAVNSGMRGGGKNVNPERAKSDAAAISQYFTMVRSEIQRLRLINSCTAENLDWRNSQSRRINDATLMNVAAIVPKTGCAVFKDRGGPVNAQMFDQYEEAGYTDFYLANNVGAWKPGHIVARWVNRINEGTDQPDVALMMSGIRTDICLTIVNPEKPLADYPNDGFSFDNGAWVAAPAITGTDRVGDDPINQYGDFFVQYKADNGRSNCTIGMIMVSQ